MSLEPGSILFTQHDNDTYPLWMLQDVKNIRTDVTVINFDMLLVKSYREDVFKKYRIEPIDQEFEESNPINLEAILNHIIVHYQKTRPFYLGLSVTADERIEDKGIGATWTSPLHQILEYTRAKGHCRLWYDLFSNT